MFKYNFIINFLIMVVNIFYFLCIIKISIFELLALTVNLTEKTIVNALFTIVNGDFYLEM